MYIIKKELSELITFLPGDCPSLWFCEGCQSYFVVWPVYYSGKSAHLFRDCEGNEWLEREEASFHRCLQCGSDDFEPMDGGF